MPHIDLPPDYYGVSSLMKAYPAPARHLDAYTQTLLRGPSSLTPAERELIAAFVSHGNACRFCAQAHAAAARELLGGCATLVDDVLRDPGRAAIDDKMQALLRIADKVRQDGRLVTADDVSAARTAGADDQAIHDTVLIAATFCMYNRYVDGLATALPADPEHFRRMGHRLATEGYGTLK
jgi:uncharacterized peroxidase-related enzyme